MSQLVDPVVRHWDFPRGIASVCLLARFAGEHGLTTDEVLAGSGLTPARLADATAEVDARQELRVVRNLATALPDAGLAVGREYHATAFGIFGFAFMSSPTMRDAVNLALRYLDLSFAFSMPRARVEDDRARMELDDSSLPADVARFLVERDLSAIHTMLVDLLPSGPPMLSLELRHPEPSTVDEYEEQFGLRPRFGGSANVAFFDATFLDEPLPLANPQTVALCEAQCRELVSQRRRRAGIAHEVRERLTRFGALAEGMPGVARELGMSTRTLRRKLEESGTSFRDLLDEVREALAEEMLTTGALSIEDVAIRLGYAEASSFIHAFKRWKGTTPAAYLRGI
ncbi:AraC-like DNA-binding protein [Amycolatopsis bartoniae]|uniref:AraC family transcriptional regulator n=1 Tax=Amycolatopsis bartoniae TaxID=941986 RepID=A0A8H9M4F6_9PSEU|nr:AraC family transcriptional regulator [Amycolatopsis bartoniae]MBB2934402.1 AraC-like DNA-binding protein [Amycolatopsis bartoniae]TVT02937.1 AraC family transcriptional regulator [Amycolatopsis bartoniae]GHF47611.1 AraC family transcriptional regulator [Amycolatopsis bartoniae]